MQASNFFTETVGIIGGVGPEATSYFVSLLVKLRGYNASRDQDHIPFLVFNNPQIPDRTDYLLHGRENPLPELIHSGTILKTAGATFLAIPCNTAHALIKELGQSVDLEVLNMIELTAQYINKLSQSGAIGLLATDGTIQTGLYQKALSRFAPNKKLILPAKEEQTQVMQAIYDIKSVSVTQHNIDLLKIAATQLTKQGANTIILGCTEIPLAFAKTNHKFTTVDPMEILARVVIERTLKSAGTHKQVTYIGTGKKF